jgi:hypothetical protein
MSLMKQQFVITHRYTVLQEKEKLYQCSLDQRLTLSNPIFLPPGYSPALIYFGREGGVWITGNYPTVFKEKNISRNRKSKTFALC